MKIKPQTVQIIRTILLFITLIAFVLWPILVPADSSKKAPETKVLTPPPTVTPTPTPQTPIKLNAPDKEATTKIVKEFEEGCQPYKDIRDAQQQKSREKFVQALGRTPWHKDPEHQKLLNKWLNAKNYQERIGVEDSPGFGEVKNSPFFQKYLAEHQWAENQYLEDSKALWKTYHEAMTEELKKRDRDFVTK